MRGVRRCSALDLVKLSLCVLRWSHLTPALGQKISRLRIFLLVGAALHPSVETRHHNASFRVQLTKVDLMFTVKDLSVVIVA